MIVDTSALVAIFADEPERASLMHLLAASESNLMSAGSWLEFGTVLVRRFGVREPHRIQRDFGAAFNLLLVPVTAQHVAVAVEGYAVFGRGAGHPAKLNFGDCFAYALVKATGEPLLFKGDDFTHTDVQQAI